MLEHPGRSAARLTGLVGITTIAVLLTGCAAGNMIDPGAPDEATPTVTRTPADTVPSSSGAPEASIPAHESPVRLISERGLPLYAPGDELALQGSEAEPRITLTVTSLSVKQTCPIDGGKPDHGAFAVLEIDASFAAPDDETQRPLRLSPQMWSFFSTDNVRFDDDLGTTAAASCQNAGTALPAELKAGASVHGTLVLDIPEPEGSLTLADADTDIAEWQLP
ncbi:MAG: hypothetical protein L0J68_03775 [Micrococcaceae bacterium]|uniref:hypothetical protein n=1 Tax=Arthrobacter sp. 179 TaxID=3457734 RepID=UPI0026568443|nr:hypothetical protein [Micrococcaceae bacterium]MDN5886423.1 hypothetical protein [Micrococcaceae bacterium]MDN6178246.1 hypothetical protein [Micrococcaceae bacterium]MDN6299396.1 hypothetical protein [Micrococcaceae bacterium]